MNKNGDTNSYSRVESTEKSLYQMTKRTDCKELSKYTPFAIALEMAISVLKEKEVEEK